MAQAAYRLWKATDDMKQANAEIVSKARTVTEEARRLVQYVEEGLHTNDHFYYGDHMSEALRNRKTAIASLVTCVAWIEMLKEVCDEETMEADIETWVKIDQTLTEAEELLGL